LDSVLFFELGISETEVILLLTEPIGVFLLLSKSKAQLGKLSLVLLQCCVAGIDGTT
jgi:hypothetical protein